MIDNPKSNLALLLLTTIVFIFYAALFPFHDWRTPSGSIFNIVMYGWFEHIFLFDVVQNLLFFLPFGLFAAGYIILQNRKLYAVLFLPTVASFCLSLCIETIQTYNPARLPSLLDVSLNTISGFLGALLSLFLMPYYPKLIQQIKSSVQMGNNKQNLWPYFGLLIWLGWAGYQLFPFIPTLHPKQLFEGILPVYLFFKKEIAFHFERFCFYALQGTLLYFSGKLFLNPLRFIPILLGFVSFIFILKMTIVARLFSIEMIAGCLGVISLLALGQKMFEYLTAPPSWKIAIQDLRSP